MGAQRVSVSRSGVQAGVVRTRRWAAICVAVAVVFCVASCGGSSTSSQSESEAQKWADSVCTSISSWRATVSKAESTLRHPADLTVNTFKSTVQDVVDATSRLVTEVGDLGRPDTSAGKQAADQLSTLSKELEKQMAVVKEAIQSGAASSAEILAKLSTITGALATMSTDIKTTVDSLGSLEGATELKDAFKSSASCQQLTAGASPT